MVAVVSATRRICSWMSAIASLEPTHLRIDAELLAEVLVLEGERLAAPHLRRDDAELLGERDRELEVGDRQRLGRRRAVKVDEPEDAVVVQDRSADERARPDRGERLALVEVAVARHVFRQDRLARRRHLVAHELRDRRVELHGRVAVTVGRQCELPVDAGEDGADLGRHRLEQPVEHDVDEVLVRRRRGHVEREAIEERQVVADAVALELERRHRDRGRRLGRRQGRHGRRRGRRRRQEARLAEPFLDQDRLGVPRRRGRAEERARRRQVFELVDENEVAAADLKLVAGRQLPFVDGGAADAGAVETLEIAEPPTVLGELDGGVFARAEFVLEDDAVGAGASERYPRTDFERVDVAVAVVVLDDQKRAGGNRSHAALPRRTAIGMRTSRTSDDLLSCACQDTGRRGRREGNAQDGDAAQGAVRAADITVASGDPRGLEDSPGG